MDQVTQKNAAMVEESTAASHALSQEADRLSELVGQFRVGQHAAAQVAAATTQGARHKVPLTALKTAPGRHLSSAALKPEPAEAGW
jgi:methyl-accepting chemotaxis protein